MTLETEKTRKREFRKNILQKRDALTIEQRHRKSQEIFHKVISQTEYQNAEKVLLFASYKSEVDTAEILNHAWAAGKKIYLPKVQEDEMEFYQIFSEEDLQEGYRGIREPKAQEGLRLVPKEGTKILMIMPGAVFDVEGNRIGYGGGFYDRYLAKLEQEIATIQKTQLCKMGICFHCQLLDNIQIPTEPWDKSAEIVITEKVVVYRSDY